MSTNYYPEKCVVKQSLLFISQINKNKKRLIISSASVYMEKQAFLYSSWKS